MTLEQPLRLRGNADDRVMRSGMLDEAQDAAGGTVKRSWLALLIASAMLGLLGVAAGASGKATGALSSGRAQPAWSIVSQHLDPSLGDVT